MKVSAIFLALHIKTYNNVPQYHSAIRLFSKIAPKIPYELIIVDNGSINNEAEKFQEAFGDIARIVALPKNTGFHVGNNAGIAYATGEYVLLHNPDIEITEGMLEALVSYMDTHPDVAVVGPRLMHKDGTAEDSYRRYMRPLDFLIKRMKFIHRYPYFKKRMEEYLMWDIDRTKIQEVDWLQGSCILIRKSMLEEIGGLNEYYFLFMGDMDLGRTFKELGYKSVYYPHVFAYHGANRVSGNGFWKSLFKWTAWLHLWEVLKYMWRWRKDLLK